MNRRNFILTSLAVTSELSLLQRRAAALAESALSSSADREAPDGDLSGIWNVPDPEIFRRALLPGPGFSFTYDGKPSASPEAVPQTVHQASAGTSETVFRFKSGLEAVRTAIAFPAFSAVEYSVRFRNTSSTTSAVVEDVNALDVVFGPKALNGAYVVSSGGGQYDDVYPPQAFAVKNHYFGATVPLDGEITLTAKGGCSSALDLPFYFIQNDLEVGGLFVGFGWSGQWSSRIRARFDGGQLRVLGGISGLQVRLEPGEELPGPHVLVGSYKGPLAAGSNRLRRLIREHYTPRLGGKEFQPIMTYDSWWYIVENYDEALLRPIADAAARIGQEYFLLDAAWFAGSNGPDGFSGGVGNWEEVDRKKFPSGLGTFADYVRSRGLKFGLWFEPERIVRGSLLETKHPDWVLWKPDGLLKSCEEKVSEKTGCSGISQVRDRDGLLDYGKPEVQVWVRDMMDRYITQLDIRYIRYDFNMDPLPYWDSKDVYDRRGITQIRHIEGFYGLIDWIREHHPDTVLEGCAGGGRRIDLETARRFHTFWISDQTVDPQIVRFHLQGINYFLPGNYHYRQYALPFPEQKNFVPTDFDYLGFLGGAFGTGGYVNRWPASHTEQFMRIAELHKKTRHYLMEDYYPLLPQSPDLNGWDGWQFHDPRSNTGFAQAFRGNSEISTMTLRLHGLRPETTYEFQDPLSSKMVRLSGAALLDRGFPWELARMSSQVFLYKSV